MTEPLNSKQAECLRPHTEPGGIIYAWLKGDDMKFNFILYCQGNPVDLEIKDAQGNWDIDTFKRHIEACGPCKRILDILPVEVLCDLQLRQQAAKGSPKTALYLNEKPIWPESKSIIFPEKDKDSSD